jgi:hypothetical protein
MERISIQRPRSKIVTINKSNSYRKRDQSHCARQDSRIAPARTQAAIEKPHGIEHGRISGVPGKTAQNQNNRSKPAKVKQAAVS